MGFWSKFGKGLLGAGGAIAAPFTGGASLAAVIPAIAGAAGSVASGISSGRAQGRVQEAGINTNQDYLKLAAARALEDALMSRAGLDLERRRFTLEAPGVRAGQAMRGDILARAQDAGIAGPIVHTRGRIPSISGGLRPSLMSGSTRALGGELSRQALLNQMAGDQFTPLPAPQIPSVTPSPQAGTFDTALNWIGGVGAGVGAIGPLLKKRPDEMPPMTGTVSPIKWPVFG